VDDWACPAGRAHSRAIEKPTCGCAAIPAVTSSTSCPRVATLSATDPAGRSLPVGRRCDRSGRREELLDDVVGVAEGQPRAVVASTISPWGIPSASSLACHALSSARSMTLKER
jgi:hypothetical protein